MSAAGYADDLLLMAPSRNTMSKILEVCEDYVVEHSLIFQQIQTQRNQKVDVF